jgi:hypothetical protein
LDLTRSATLCLKQMTRQLCRKGRVKRLRRLSGEPSHVGRHRGVVVHGVGLKLGAGNGYCASAGALFVVALQMVCHQGVAESKGGRREHVGHGGVEGWVVGVGVGGGVPARGGSLVDSEFFLR